MNQIMRIRIVISVFLLAMSLVSCSGGDHASGSRSKGSVAVEDFSTKRIAVLLGSTHDQYARKHFPQATIQEYKSVPDMILAVKTGKADAGIYNSNQLPEVMHEQSGFMLVGKPLFSADIAVGIGKGNDGLRLSFNSFLEEIRRNGVYDDMVTRWLKKGDYRMPAIPEAPGDQGSIIVGMSYNMGLPFTAFSDNRLIGFNVEMVERFGAYLGKRVVYEDYEFGNLIAALVTGKIDMIGSLLAITEERKMKIDYSDPYINEDAYLFSLRKHVAQGGVQSGSGDAGDTFGTVISGIEQSFRSNIVEEDRWKLIVGGLWVTVVISFFATLLGTLFGGVICFLRMSKNRMFRGAARAYISIMRGTPVLVVLMLIFYVVFASVNIDPVMVAVIAFGMNFAAYVSEMYRSGIESIDRGQTEAGIAMGFSRFDVFRYIILPQTVVRILPVYKGEFISLVKMTSIVGYIAVQDLTKASDIIRSRTFDAFFPIIMVAVLYYLISWSLLFFLDRIEKKIDPKKRKQPSISTF